MGKAIGIGTSIGKGTTGSVGPAPGNVSAITVTGFIDPTTLAITLTVQLTPPSDSGDTITSGHLYLEVPDQSSGASFIVGTSVIGDGSTPIGPWTLIDCGIQPIAALAAGVTFTVPGPPGIDASVNIVSRLYVNSVSANGENKLVRANLTSPTPNATFTLISLASGTPTSGTNVATLTTTTGPVAIVATALDPVNVTGKLETPVVVSVSNVPVVPKGENRLGLGQWCYQLVLTYAGQDPTVPANQFVAAAGPFFSAGIVGQSLYELASADGVSVPHSFLLATPTTITNAIVWLQAGTVNAAGVFTGNNIVPGITPSFPIEYGSTIGTTDASSILASSIAASMAVVDGLFGVATAGITNTLLGSGAVGTLNIAALAITNPLLASLAVEAVNMAASSITGTAGGSGNQAIAALAVATAAIQTAAITNALIANAAIDSAQIVSATITGANIAIATIAGANIASATITQANMASASIGNAQIQAASIDAAQINTCSVNSLTAGTLSATISITSPTITCTNGFEVTTNGITTTISNATFGSFAAGLKVSDGTHCTFANSEQLGVCEASGPSNFYAVLQQSGTIGELLLADTTGTLATVTFSPGYFTSPVGGGAISMPTMCHGFIQVTVSGLGAVNIPIC